MSNILNTTKLLSKGDKKLLSELQLAVNEHKSIITCMGLYNHGKSTLLNVLIEDFNMNTFKTADIRETSKNKSVNYENMIFTDTPGLNAKEHDDKRVMEAVKKSDINIFVHNVTTGEFNQKEIEFLDNIVKHWSNPEEFIQRTIFVLSRIDNLSNKNDIKATMDKMSMQIKDRFMTSPTIDAVSAISYAKGKLGNKPLLIKDSNIENLKTFINQLNKNLSSSIKKTKRKRLNEYYFNLIKKLTSKLEKNKLNISLMENDIEKRKKDLDSIVTDVREILSKTDASGAFGNKSIGSIF